MTGKAPDDDPLRGVELSRRELIQRIVVGSAFALPVIASFDMASLEVSSAYANSPNQAGPLTFTSANATTFALGQPASFDVTTHGPGPVTVSAAGSLPNGVTFTQLGNSSYNDVNAVISGTPAPGTLGPYSLTLTASDGNAFNTNPDVTQAFTLTVGQPPAFTSPAAATLSTGQQANVGVTTSGYPAATISFAGTLPPGMAFIRPIPANGEAAISGKPQVPGVFAVTLTASNGVGASATQTLTLTVQEAPAFTSAAAATFPAAQSSSFDITTAGSPAATISLSGSLPSGMHFAADPATGTAVLSGKPQASAVGIHHLTLTASNGVSPSATQAFVLTVTPSNAFSVSHVTTGTSTEITFDVKVLGAGTITAIVTAPPGAASASLARKVKRKRVTVARTKVRVKHGETVKLKTKPNGAGRRFARSTHRHGELWLIITFAPSGGKARSHTVKHLHLK